MKTAKLNPILAIEACPKCDYSLNGLGEQGRCPECGLEFDKAGFMVESPLPSDSPWIVILGAGSQIMFGVFSLWIGLFGMWGLAYIALGAFVLSIWLLRRRWVINDRPNRIVVMRQGLHLIRSRGYITTIPLEKLGPLAFDYAWGGIYVTSGNHRHSYINRGTFLGTERRTKVFTKAFNAWLEEQATALIREREQESASLWRTALKGPAE